MPRFEIYWSERRRAEIEADTREEVMEVYSAGDYDSDYLYDHDFVIQGEPCPMTKQQRQAIRCAYLDLKGALEAQEACDLNSHDWKAHKASIQDLEEAFDSILEEEDDVV